MKSGLSSAETGAEEGEDFFTSFLTDQVGYNINFFRLGVAILLIAGLNVRQFEEEADDYEGRRFAFFGRHRIFLIEHLKSIH
jgi:hypothetical protein